MAAEKPASTGRPSLAAALIHEERLRRRLLPGGQKEPVGPPRPIPTVYHAGKQQYQPASLYQNNGRPRRCRAGSGTPSYSTRRPAEVHPSAVTPPVAGAFLPQWVQTPTAFRDARAELSLPVRIDNSSGGASLSVEWTTPVEEVDVQVVLPLLLQGLRDDTFDGRFVAMQGATELVAAAGPKGKLLRLTSQLIEPIRLALATLDPPVICAAMQILRQFLSTHRLAGAALRPHFRQLLPKLAPLVLRGQERQPINGEHDRASDREMNPSDLAATLLHEMEARGGKGAGSVIKACIPSWHSSDEQLHRGFVAPLFKNGDTIRVALGVVIHSSGVSVSTQGRAMGTSQLQGLEQKVGETINLQVHGRPRMAVSFVNPAKR